MSIMINFILVACGGAIGSVMRYGVGLLFSLFNLTFPMATLICNVFGSFLLGILVAILSKNISEAYRLFLTVGICGGFTSFSTFSLEAINLTQQNNWFMLAIYIAVSIIVSLLAVYLGLKINY